MRRQVRADEGGINGVWASDGNEGEGYENPVQLAGVKVLVES